MYVFILSEKTNRVIKCIWLLNYAITKKKDLNTNITWQQHIQIFTPELRAE